MCIINYQIKSTLFQNADRKLVDLDEFIEEVRSKSQRVAEYFCDNREDFIENVFEEMWKFIDAFQNAEKVHLFDFHNGLFNRYIFSHLIYKKHNLILIPNYISFLYKMAEKPAVNLKCLEKIEIQIIIFFCM